MEEYKKKFIEFMIKSDVLSFGDFKLKSGRIAPYFINTGKYRNGEQISKLAEFYCAGIFHEFGKDFHFDFIFGPAYKGIPLCVAASMIFNNKHSKVVNFSFNRKELKDHGEGGGIVGYAPKDGDKVLIIEDVTTSGASIRETVPILKANADVEIIGLIVSVDRMEKGTGEKGALIQLSEDYSMKTASIVNIKEIIEYLHNREISGKIIIDDDRKDKIEEYLNKYGY